MDPETAAGMVEAKLARYTAAAPVFDATTREYKLIVGLAAAVRAKDVDAFGDAVHDFDAILPMDDLQRMLCVRAKAAVRSSAQDIS